MEKNVFSFINLILYLVYTYQLAFSGYKGEVPTYYEIIISISYQEATTCSDANIDMSIKDTGIVKKGVGVYEYLFQTEHTYYRFSEHSLFLFGCSSYHQPNEYFDLMTSNCPSLKKFQDDNRIGEWDSYTIYFYDTYLRYSNRMYILKDSSLCLENDPTPTPSSNNSVIIIVVVVIIVIIIITITILLLLKKNKKHELKKVDKSIEIKSVENKSVENKNDLSTQHPISYPPNTILVSSPQPNPSQQVMFIPSQSGMSFPSQQVIFVPSQSGLSNPSQPVIFVPSQSGMSFPSQQVIFVPSQSGLSNPSQ